MGEWAAEPIFSVEQLPNGNFAVQHRQKGLIGEISVTITDGNAVPKIQQSYQELSDGRKVWNRWCETPEQNFRQEIVLSADTSELELSFLGEAPAYSNHRNRLMTLSIPYTWWQGMKFRGYQNHARSGGIEAGGKFTADLPDGDVKGDIWRWLSVDGGAEKQVTFDLDPIGPSNSSTFYPTGVIRGCWNFLRKQDRLVLVGGNRLSETGGLTGAKVVLREGTFEQFQKIHALNRFNYDQPIPPLTLDSFGAEKTGDCYHHFNLTGYSTELKRGWSKLDQGKSHTGPEGACYSMLEGQNGSFCFEPLPNGFHLFHLTAGNFAGVANRFAIAVNGQTQFADLSVPRGKLLDLVIPVWVTEGKVQIDFDGHFLLSTLGHQYLISQNEDYSFKRAFWVTDGYEPAFYFRSKNYNPELKLTPTAALLDMPVPGSETNGPRKELAAPVELPDNNAPELAWCTNARIQMMGATYSSLAEYTTDPAQLERFLDEAQQRGTTVLMVSGMHGRHLFPGTLDDSVAAIHKIVEAAHKRGIKVIDHHDCTFMENWEQGFRVMAERSGELAYDITHNTPSPQFCLVNPQFTRTYREYLKKLIRAGVDGFQIDELYFYRHCCLCPSCRKGFHQDTGWYLPMNELDSRLTDKKSNLWKLWFTWRNNQIGNWWVELRRETKELNPHLVLSLYGCHWETLKSMPDQNLTLDLAEQARGINMFGTEIMPRNSYNNARSLFPYRKLYNMYRIAYNAPPIWAWYYSKDWNVAYWGWAVSNMLAQTALIDDESVRPADGADFHAFAASIDNPPIRKLSRTAKVAVLYHSASRDYNAGIGFETEFGGLTQSFEGTHIPYDVIDTLALHLDNILANYRVLIVGSAGCLTDADVAQIKRFAAAGGTVYLGCIAGLFDRWGTPRKEWPFKEVFGFAPKYPNAQKLTAIKLAGERELSLNGVWDAYLYAYPLEGKVRGKVLMEATSEQQQAMPLVVSTPLGQGCICYMSGMLFSTLWAEEEQIGNQWRFRFHEALENELQKLLVQVTAPAAIWQIKAPKLVYTNLWTLEGGTILVNFLNGTGTSLAPGETIPGQLTRPAWPALTEDIEFLLPGIKAQTVYAVSPDFEGHKALPFSVSTDGLHVTLPKELLKAYTIVYIK